MLRHYMYKSIKEFQYTISCRNHSKFSKTELATYTYLQNTTFSGHIAAACNAKSHAIYCIYILYACIHTYLTLLQLHNFLLFNETMNKEFVMDNIHMDIFWSLDSSTKNTLMQAANWWDMLNMRSCKYFISFEFFCDPSYVIVRKGTTCKRLD